MSYRQLVTPNLDPIIKQPNNIGGTYIVMDWYGWCLAYIQYAFGVGWAGDPASDAWNNRLSQKHQDRNLPSGVYVPIWFSGYGGQGHAAIYKDGQVWSSPWHHKATYDVMPSIAETERIYGVTYIGWSEDLAGRQLIEQVADLPAPPPSPKYQVTETYPDGKQIQLNKDTNLWGMNYDFDTMVKNPVETDHKQGEIWTITNKVHHQDSYDYYRRADQVDGFNVLDCDDYTPPPAAPYVPPAAPEVAPAAQKYTVKATVMYFGNAQDAQFRKNTLGTIQPSKEYYIFEIANSVVYLGKDNMHAQYWINTKDNVVPVVVKEPPKPVEKPKALLPSQVKVGTENDPAWKGSYRQFYPDGRSDKYKALHDITFLDYDGRRGKDTIPEGQVLPVPGTFEKDGVIFYRPRSGKDEYFSWWYGIPMFDDNGVPNLVKVTPTLDKIEIGLRDLPRLWIEDIKQALKKKVSK